MSRDMLGTRDGAGMFVVRLSDSDSPYKAFSDRSRAIIWGSSEIAAGNASTGDLFEVSASTNAGEAVETVRAGNGRHIQPIVPKFSADQLERAKRREAIHAIAKLNLTKRP
jgi:hypothetical protein